MQSCRSARVRARRGLQSPTNSRRRFRTRTVKRAPTRATPATPSCLRSSTRPSRRAMMARTPFCAPRRSSSSSSRRVARAHPSATTSARSSRQASPRARRRQPARRPTARRGPSTRTRASRRKRRASARPTGKHDWCVREIFGGSEHFFSPHAPAPLSLHPFRKFMPFFLRHAFIVIQCDFLSDRIRIRCVVIEWRGPDVLPTKATTRFSQRIERIPQFPLTELCN